ncbi:TPA: hypothetical protein EYP37_12910 [Candidatus Poribacteria bacterium]|nr:hypothetical protein [Candidatus Poribacteria bacterium]
MKVKLISLVGLVTLTLFLIPSVFAVDMALYTGHTNPGWYAEAVMLQDAEKIMSELKGVVKEIVSFNDDKLDDLKAWAEANLKDGELDIIWLPGVIPSVLYPNPNKQPDGSLAEEWLDNGNMFINCGDYFAYCTYETGARGADNGEGGIQNIIDCPGMTMWGDNTPMKVTGTGKKYIPSLEDFLSDRPFHVNELNVNKDWEVVAIFASQGGSDDPAKETRADPIVIHNKVTDGYLCILVQNAEPMRSHADNTIDFVKNWANEVIGFSVEPQDKLATTWGEIKR